MCGKSANASDVHHANAPLPMVLTFVCERSAIVMLVEWNALFPISSSVEGKSATVSDVQRKNALSPILVTFVCERSTEMIVLFRKAILGIS